MRLLCITSEFYRSISNGEDRKKFEAYAMRRRWPIIQVSLPDAKTQSQNSAVWRDFTIAGQWLGCDKETVYHLVRFCEQLEDIWLTETKVGKKNIPSVRYRSLSELTKDETSELIPRMRDYLQGLIDESEGETIIINWSNKENMLKE